MLDFLEWGEKMKFDSKKPTCLPFSSFKYKGSYIVNNYLHIVFPEKPHIIHRFFTKLLLGWEWKDK